MRALVVLVVVLLPIGARADDATAQRDLVIEYTRIARGAAMGGDCDTARDLAERVRTLDPVFYASEVATDTAIASCLPPPASPAAVAPVEKSAPLPPVLAPPGVSPRVDAPPRIPHPPLQPPAPPLSGGRIVGEIIVGGLLGIVGGLIGGLAGAVVCADGDGEFACLGSVIIGGYFGGAAAFGLGVAAVGKSGDQDGSVGAAVLGGVLGAGVGLVSLFALDDGGGNEGAIVTLFVGAPIVGALFGFNATRRWRAPKSPRVGSLLRLDGGSVSLGIPVVVHAEQRGVPTTSVSLFSGAF